MQDKALIITARPALLPHLMISKGGRLVIRQSICGNYPQSRRRKHPLQRVRRHIYAGCIQNGCAPHSGIGRI